jgi:D-glycero-D-manno-heptose 1,7-bisphosphate phosphatase
VSRAPAVLLDRDGTLIEEAGYIDRIARMRLFPYTIDALRVLQTAGFRLVVVTNQAGVARGIFGEAFVAEAHAWLREQFARGGVRIDGVYYCPHHPDATVQHYRQKCECRKPQPGMALRAAIELGLDLERSYVVGDKWLDVGLANATGAQGILVRTGYGATDEAHPMPGVSAATVVDHVHAAAVWILQQQGRTGRS